MTVTELSPAAETQTGIVGWVRVDAENILRGWAMDRHDRARRLRISVHIDRERVASLSADRFDPMLQAMGEGDGRYGFAMAIPLRFRDGRPHRFSVKIKAGARAGNESRTFQAWEAEAPRIEVLRAGYGGLEGRLQGGLFSAATRLEVWQGGQRITDPLETIWFGRGEFQVHFPPALAKLTRLNDLVLAVPGMVEGGFAGEPFQTVPGGRLAGAVESEADDTPESASAEASETGPARAVRSDRLMDIDITIVRTRPFRAEVLRCGGTSMPWQKFDPQGGDQSIHHRPPKLLNRERLDSRALNQWQSAYEERLFAPRTIAEDMVFTLPDALVVPATFAVLTPTHRVARETYRVAKCFLNFARHPSFHDARISIFRDTAMLDGTVASVGPMEFRNFYHWMTEGMPRAHMLRTVFQEPFRLLVPEAAPGYVLKSLEMLGYKPQDLIAASGRTTYRCERALFATTPVRSITDLAPWLFEFYRKVADGCEAVPVEGVGPDILITRSGAPTRRLVNEAEMLGRLGPSFVPVRLEVLSLPQQIAIMRRAKRIVSPHGAGLTLLLAASPDVTVVEMHPDSFRTASSYWAISDQRGLRYAAVLGRAHDPDSHNSDFTLDAASIGDIVRFLDASA